VRTYSFRTIIFTSLLLVTMQSQGKDCELFCLEPIASDSPTDIAVKEGLLSLRAARLFVLEYRFSMDRWPNKNEAAQVASNLTSNNYVVTIGRNGKITIKYNKNSLLRGVIFTATPSIPVPLNPVWSCKTKGLDSKYLSPSCQEIYLTTQSR
jgi:hypothetical protein